MEILHIVKEAYVLEIITIGLVLNSYKDEVFIANITQCLKIIYKNFLYITYFAIQISSNESPGADKCMDMLNSYRLSEYNQYRKNINSNNKTLNLALLKYLESAIKDDEANIRYFESCLKNRDTSSYEDLRDFVYNELFLNNLLHYKVGEPEIVICDQEEDCINPPFLPESNLHIYTLVLDLDETLVHYVEEDGMAFVQIRPGTENFLIELKDYFEIVIFTAALSDVIYVFKIVCRYGFG